MKISSKHLSDLNIVVALEEADRYVVTYDGRGYRSKENGLPLVIHRIRFMVDMLDGGVTTQGYGYLVNKDGSIGERSRDVWLEVDNIPVQARHIAAEEWRSISEQIGVVTGVSFG